MSKTNISISKMISGAILVGTTICLLCSCSQKISESNRSGDGYTQRTEVVKEGDHLKTTTITTEIEPLNPVNKDDSVHITTSQSDGINVRLPDDDTSDGRVRVRAPFVKLDSDNVDGSVHLRAPFLKIDKSGYGGKVRVRIPGVHVNAD